MLKHDKVLTFFPMVPLPPQLSLQCILILSCLVRSLIQRNIIVFTVFISFSYWFCTTQHLIPKSSNYAVFLPCFTYIFLSRTTSMSLLQESKIICGLQTFPIHFKPGTCRKKFQNIHWKNVKQVIKKSKRQKSHTESSVWDVWEEEEGEESRVA